MNPESAWPHLSDLSAAAAERCKNLLPRLPIYPEYLNDAVKWLSDKRVTVDEQTALPTSGTGGHKQPNGQHLRYVSPLSASLRLSDASGLGRASLWHAGEVESEVPISIGNDPLGSGAGAYLVPEDNASGSHSQAPNVPRPRTLRWAVERGVHGGLIGCVTPEVSTEVTRILTQHQASMSSSDHCGSDMDWEVNDVVSLLTACGSSAEAVVNHADAVRKERCGDRVSYVVNRNINYTNVRFSRICLNFVQCNFVCILCSDSAHLSR